MSTSLYIISNIKTSKEEVEEKKDIYLQKLNNLKLGHTYYPKINDITGIEEIVKDEGEWEYEYPIIYEDEVDEYNELLFYESPTVFSITVHNECLVLSTIYKYSYLYEHKKYINIDEHKKDVYEDSFMNFRKNILDIISIFGGKEIIYLADNGCNKMGSYLECKVWEGVSYNQIKQEMENDGTDINRDTMNLNYDSLNYEKITEYIFDDFKDFKKKIMQLSKK